MTETGNFYIFAQNSQKEESLILVHCLAQIDNPHSSEHWIHSAFELAGFLGLNEHQNQEEEHYLHPMVSLMRVVGNEHRKNKIVIAHGENNHLQFGGGSKSSGSSSSSSSSRSSSWGYSSSSWASGIGFSSGSQTSRNNQR